MPLLVCRFPVTIVCIFSSYPPLPSFLKPSVLWTPVIACYPIECVHNVCSELLRPSEYRSLTFCDRRQHDNIVVEVTTKMWANLLGEKIAQLGKRSFISLYGGTIKENDNIAPQLLPVCCGRERPLLVLALSRFFIVWFLFSRLRFRIIANNRNLTQLPGNLFLEANITHLWETALFHLLGFELGDRKFYHIL